MVERFAFRGPGEAAYSDSTPGILGPPSVALASQ